MGLLLPLFACVCVFTMCTISTCLCMFIDTFVAQSRAQNIDYTECSV